MEMNEKVTFSPFRCENPACRKWVLFRTEWLDIMRNYHRGHGYRVCRKCLKSTVKQVEEHNLIAALSEIGANIQGNPSVISVGVTIKGKFKMVDAKQADKIQRKLHHSCPFCLPCPTHGR